jgi:glycosyltransferase involved in cell wall biosynthesis
MSDRSAAAPIRVLRIIARLNIGGPARHVLILSDALRSRGFETFVAYGSTSEFEESLEDALQEQGVRSIKLPQLGRRIRPWSDARVLAQLVALMKRERPDIVHTHTAKAGTLGRLAALVYNATQPRTKRCLVVHTFHGHVLTGYFGKVGSLAARFIERTLSIFTDTVIAISESQRLDLTERFRVAASSKIAVIPLGLELRDLLVLGENDGNGASLREELGIGLADVVIGYVGRFVPIKDLDALLHGFARAGRRVPGIRLLLVGDGECRDALKRRTARLGLTGQVHFAGWRHDLTAVYAVIDVFALSSLNEGTPVAAIEAMAAGRAVVATRVGGVGDIIEHGVTGLLVEPRDAPALGDALAALAGSAELRTRLGCAARQFVATRFASSRLVDDIEALYRSALRTKRRDSDASAVALSGVPGNS